MKYLNIADVEQRIEQARACDSKLRGQLTLSCNGVHRVHLRGHWCVDRQREIFHNLIRFKLPWADFWLDVKQLTFTERNGRLDAVTPGPLPFLFWNPKGLPQEGEDA